MTTCPGPLVSKASCASDLRALCSASSGAQTRAMMYAFSPGVCGGDTAHLAEFDTDLANFLLSRGPYAWLGHGWNGCSQVYEYPDALNADYGEPLALCAETAPGSGVFTRRFSKSTVTMDCNNYTPTITFP
jgi:hypothetical protein